MSIELGFAERLRKISIPDNYLRRTDAEADETQKGLRIYPDAPCFHVDGVLEKTVVSGGTFKMIAPFSSAHPLLAGKSEEEQEAILHKLITTYSSQRSKLILVGIQNTSDVVEVTKTEDGWNVTIDFENTGPGNIIVPAGLEMLTPFEIEGNAMTGRELVILASELHHSSESTNDIPDGIQIQTHGGTLLTFDNITKILDEGDTSLLFNPEHPQYPEGIFLAYDETVGFPSPHEEIRLQDLPPRREGLLERFTSWYSRDFALRRLQPRIALYKTTKIALPKGHVGVIDREKIGESSRHSWSILLYDNHSNGHRYAWEIVGEHQVNGHHPKGFIMRLYRKAS